MPPTLEDEDTIIVKGEDWRSSSPDSTNPAIDPLVANLMAQINSCSSPLESPSTMPDPQSSTIHVSYPPDGEQTESADPSPKRRVVQGTMEERLQSMPKLREMPWRPGTELPLVETGGESRRKQIRFGTLLATRGNVVSEPCKTCASGRGKFSVCVALEGFFKGACASCQLSGRPNRCTIKLQDEPKAEPESSELTIIAAPEQDERHSNGRQTSSNGLISQIQPPKATQSQFQIQTPSQPRRKGSSHRDHSTENLPAKRRRTDGPQWDKSLAASQLQQAKEPPVPTWAAVNRPESAAPTSNGAETNGKVLHNYSSYGRREDTAAVEDGSVPLIDTFPKSKQRQLYGIVSGLQGGIEHLQKELDILKKALGIDDGD